jgi:hypothetical protein
VGATTAAGYASQLPLMSGISGTATKVGPGKMLIATKEIDLPPGFQPLHSTGSPILCVDSPAAILASA